MHTSPQPHSLHPFAPLRLCVRRLVLCVLLVGCATGAFAAEPQHAELRRACEYLWSQQAADGGWHSKQYSMLRSGEALTPFVLHALLEVPESICPRPAGGVERALDFIRRHVDEQGAIGKSDPEIVEYPVYSTAYALLCLVTIESDEDLVGGSDTQLKSDMYCFLSKAQFDEADGFSTIDVAYGGWGFDLAKDSGDPGHMDLAHTRRAMQALRKYVHAKSWPPFTRAELFLRVVQRDPGRLAEPAIVERYLHYRSTIPFDGGFYFSPVVEAANKGRFTATHDGEAAPHFRSYATATCDGILALLAAGVPRDDDRVLCAVEWLTAHDDFTYPQGVPTDHPEPWGEAIRFYHYAVRAEAYAALDWPGDWRARLTALVAKTQATDGSFRNTASPLMKEDDPLLCTALAVVALGHSVAPPP
jgi:hypothetical protein